MGKKYTREEIWQMCQDALVGNVSLFYTNKFINYQGTIDGEDTYYTEVIAEFVLENIIAFKNIPTISRHEKNKSYKQNHIGEYDPNTNRIEEKNAMDMFVQSQNGHAMDYVGKIIDYQTPLKATEKDKAGKIDLLSETEDAIYILELKKEDSMETMLRCVLEGYTYLKTVNQEELLSDFNRPLDKPIYAAPLVFRGAAQWKEMQEIEKHPMLIRLMKELDVKGPFYLIYDSFYNVTIQ